MYSDKLHIIIDFVQSKQNGTYHPIKEKYTVLKDFIHEGKIYRKNDYVYLGSIIEGYTKKHSDQSIYNENVMLLKEYISWRIDQGEEKSRYKTITFAPDFKSIRIGI